VCVCVCVCVCICVFVMYVIVVIFIDKSFCDKSRSNTSHMHTHTHTTRQAAVILPKTRFSVENGLLTPLGKKRRLAISKLFEEEIARAFAEVGVFCLLIFIVC